MKTRGKIMEHMEVSPKKDWVYDRIAGYMMGILWLYHGYMDGYILDPILMEVSQNGGTPKWSILVRCSIVNHPTIATASCNVGPPVDS